MTNSPTQFPEIPFPDNAATPLAREKGTTGAIGEEFATGDHAAGAADISPANENAYRV
jgi:hypothetical protein